MEAKLQIEPDQAKIMLTGDFTFEGHRVFKEATQPLFASNSIDKLIIDFASVDYMDSAALGMLLLLRERMGERNIQLANTRGTVRAVLDVANFGRLFDIA